MPDMAIYIGADGVITFVHDDKVMEALQGQGRITVTRVSHVEPCPDDNTKWQADMSPICGQPVLLGPFDSRQVALEAERLWLEEWLLRGQHDPVAKDHQGV